MIDLGTQKNEYQGQITHKRQVLIGWELTDELIPNAPKTTASATVTMYRKPTIGEIKNVEKIRTTKNCPRIALMLC